MLVPVALRCNDYEWVLCQVISSENILRFQNKASIMAMAYLQFWLGICMLLSIAKLAKRLAKPVDQTMFCCRKLVHAAVKVRVEASYVLEFAVVVSSSCGRVV